jgi:uncharacterized damage-inducible protein DinB
MSRAAVEMLTYLLDQAFEGNDEHSLLANLVNVTPEDWLARPVEGARNIRELVDHAGVAKYLYGDHLFGAATLTYMDALKTSPSAHDSGDIDGVKRWLRRGHERFKEGLAALTDDDLLKPRKAHWGAPGETRWLISVVIQHDVYHAGEINHLRAQRQGTDRWPGRAPQ